MNPDPINQIEGLAARTVELYGSVSGQSYVTGHAAAQDARKVLAVIDGMVFYDLYQCDECGRVYDFLDLCNYCGGDVTALTVLSKRRKRGARK